MSKIITTPLVSLTFASLRRKIQHSKQKPDLMVHKISVELDATQKDHQELIDTINEVNGMVIQPVKDSVTGKLIAEKKRFTARAFEEPVVMLLKDGKATQVSGEDIPYIDTKDTVAKAVLELEVRDYGQTQGIVLNSVFLVEFQEYTGGRSQTEIAESKARGLEILKNIVG